MSEEQVNFTEHTNQMGQPIQPANNDEKNLGMLAHLLAIFTMFIGPLVIWLVKKDESAYVAQEAKEALNFQISLLIYYVATILIIVVTAIMAAVSMGILSIISSVASLLPTGIYIFGLIVMIMGTVESTKKGGFKYPLCLRLIQ